MATKAKASLINTFLKLTEECEYEKITVTNLVESCGISRQTFYYHFDDIDSMIEWAFENETKQICNKIDYSNPTDSAEKYAEFLKKYDTLLVKAAASDDCLKIYNLIYKSFIAFITEFISGKRGNSSNGEEAEFFISYCASAFTGLVIIEIQKKERNYSELMKKLVKSLKTI